MFTHLLFESFNFSRTLQGLYEYGKPKWEERPRPANEDMDYSKFGATLQSRPTFSDNHQPTLDVAGTAGVQP